MEDGNEDKRAIDLDGLREALSSSSTKKRGMWLGNLHQQILDSGWTKRLPPYT